MQDPIAPVPPTMPAPAGSEFAPCPKCASTNAKKVNYTWWGGMLGPKIFNHVRCNNCGTYYNGKSGNSNVTAIIIYSVVIIVVCGFLGVIIGMMGN